MSQAGTAKEHVTPYALRSGEKYAKLVIVPSLCVVGGYSNEDFPLHKWPMVEQQAAEWKCVVVTT